MRQVGDEHHGLVELRRGMITLAVMLHLRTENHGYALRQTLESQGLPLKEGTLYPLLRRLEEQRVLTSRWDVSGDRARRYYALTTSGYAVLSSLHDQWRHLIQVVENVVQKAIDGYTEPCADNKRPRAEHLHNESV